MANGIKLGSITVDSFKVGSGDCTIYLGDTLLYSGGTTPPTPPSFNGKWLAIYTGGTTSSAECDASSAITQNEITLTDLASVEIGDCVASIGDWVFASCTSITSITISNSVTSIDQSAFRSCTGLTSITIPYNVTNIGSQVLYSCNNLTSIIILPTTPPTLGLGAFNITNGCPIYVPSGSVETYKTASGWSSYASRIQAIPSPQTLQWVTFSNGDTIPSYLQIYGIKGIVNDLNKAFGLETDNIYVEDAGRNKYNVIIGGYSTSCYNESDIVSNTSVEYTFSNVGCSDYYTVSSKTIANMSNDIQLYIYS